MRIKSLLLGSAAAMVAATGAKAADAIVVAEPEPVEYVRVCDAYGAGFFYIPGTETCLSINGYVWFQVAGSSANDFGPTVNLGGGLFYGSGNYPVWGSRIRINFDSRSDTEWGTLRGFIRLQADWNAQNQTAGTLALTSPLGLPPINLTVPGVTTLFGTDGGVYVDQAWIELGGLRMGYSDSIFNYTTVGGVSNWGSHSWGGMAYAYQQRQFISYSFTGGNGIHATIALEDDGNANWMPDVVGVIGMNQGWGGVWAKIAYDEDIHSNGAILPTNIMPLNPWSGIAGMTGNDGWAASVGMQFNMPNMPGSNLRLIGFYADSANAYSTGAEWSLLASYRHQFSSSLAASVAAQYFSNTDFAVPGSPDRWQAELSVVWFPVTNFEVRGELTYNKPQGVDGTTSGFLRFTRYF
jgi:hypothetical protein